MPALSRSEEHHHPRNERLLHEGAKVVPRIRHRDREALTAPNGQGRGDAGRTAPGHTREGLPAYEHGGLVVHGRRQAAPPLEARHAADEPPRAEVATHAGVARSGLRRDAVRTEAFER